MGRRADRREPIWREGPALFGFLLDAGFLGPERLDDGIAYHRPNLHVEVRFIDGWEPELATQVYCEGPDGLRWASLNCLYVARGGGVLQDVPGNVPNLRTTTKRLHQHARALRQVLPCLLEEDVGELVRRCQGRLLPDP
jgi:hypothetical protein